MKKAILGLALIATLWWFLHEVMDRTMVLNPTLKAYVAQVMAEKYGMASRSTERDQDADLPPIDHNDMRTIYARLPEGAEIILYSDVGSGTYAYVFRHSCRLKDLQGDVAAAIGAGHARGLAVAFMNEKTNAMETGCEVTDSPKDVHPLPTVYFDPHYGDRVLWIEYTEAPEYMAQPGKKTASISASANSKGL